MTMRKMLRRTAIALVAARFLFASSAASAWNASGHMIIAARAYDEMKPETRARADALLREHPDYESWRGALAADSGVAPEKFSFMKASVWADEIRRKGNALDRPNWHYINYPLIEREGFPEKPGSAPGNDALFGIEESERGLADRSRTGAERATDLAWLLHLIGDLHQPLHCATWIGKGWPAPWGDRGGNSFYIRPNRAGVKLHAFWDGLLGKQKSPRALDNEAIKLRAGFPRAALPELGGAKDAKAWSLESRRAAIESAYLGGKLPGSPRAEDAKKPPEDYGKNSKAVAERRAALAAFRIADRLEELLRE